MNNPEQVSALLKQVFTRIQYDQMAGIPILNNRLRVQTLGFQVYRGRCIGLLITPWLMNLMIFPGEGEDWSSLKLGSKQERSFPANSYNCMVNEVDGIGLYQSHSLYSPMREFHTQEHAVAAAESFMEALMVQVDHPDRDPHDEELLGRILRGEEEVDLSEFDTIEPMGRESKVGSADGKQESFAENITRRELLRGNFLKGGQNG